MKQVFAIAADEWRYWLRSHLAMGSALIFLALIVATSVLNVLRTDAETHARIHQQTEAEETFLSQPDRHPHRMVHYGHYLFRAPAPLATFDPGLDAVTGQSIFLEGHRQNSVMFAESAASTNFGSLSWLTPALIYQLFAPLIIILLGHGSMIRERESAVLAQMLAIGISGRTLLCGKALAMLSFILLLLLPLIFSCLTALSNGESLNALLLLFGVYYAYLCIWGTLTLLASIAFNKRSTVLATMAGLWFVFSLVLPSIAVNVVSDTNSVAGKIETDLEMLTDLRKLGDGHNANSPAFQQLRADLLEQYNVERVEDLPINYRGVVAMEAEQKLTKVLNDYAEARMSSELRQVKHLTTYAWFTPALAIASASRSIAGTDLAHYHRFQREAESVRYEFVQGLNRAHVEELSYQDDINRNKDEESSMRARVDASNWHVLDAYQFKTATLSKRITNASFPIQILLAWLLVSLGILFWRGGRITQ